MSPCDIPFWSRYPRIVVPMLIEMDTASTEPFVISEGIVCMSAISHKVNTDNHLVNDYLRGFSISVTSPGSCLVHFSLQTRTPTRSQHPVRPVMDRHHITKQLPGLRSNMLNNFFLSAPKPPINAAKILRRGDQVDGRILLRHRHGAGPQQLEAAVRLEQRPCLRVEVDEIEHA